MKILKLTPQETKALEVLLRARLEHIDELFDYCRTLIEKKLYKDEQKTLKKIKKKMDKL